MVRLWWTCLAVVLCVESVTPASTPRESNDDLTAIIKDLQVWARQAREHVLLNVTDKE